MELRNRKRAGKLVLFLSALILACHCGPLTAAASDALQDEFGQLKRNARDAGGFFKLSEANQQRYLELKYMIGSDFEKPLTPAAAKALATLELSAEKVGGPTNLPAEDQRRLLELRIMRGNLYNQPLPPDEAKELASLQIKTRQAGGESHLTENEYTRIVELRKKLARATGGSPF